MLQNCHKTRQNNQPADGSTTALLQMSQIKKLTCWSGSSGITTELQWMPLKRNKQLHKLIWH